MDKNTVVLSPMFKPVASYPEWGELSIPDIANEVSLFSSTPATVREKGGPLTKEMLDTVEHSCKDRIYSAHKAGLHPIVDVRVQRLMPGMYPSIPGWHCDAVPRPDYHAQPDFSLINPASFHVTVIASTSPGVSNTEFLRTNHEFTFEPDRAVWKQLHEQLELSITPGVNTLKVRPGDFILFDSYTPHKASRTHIRGWRIFFRYSMYHNPPIENGVPNAQQVYVLSESNGW